MTVTAAANTITATERERNGRPTRVTVELADGHARIRTLDPGSFMAARPLETRGHYARIALIGNHMSLLGGDIIDLRIQVETGVTLEVVEPVGTVAYDADEQRSDWHLTASVADGAMLIWHGNRFVAARGSNAHRATELTLGRDARALLKETLVLGRSGETAIRLRNRTHVSLEQRELLVEDLEVTPDTPNVPGVIGSSGVVSTVIAAGWRPAGDEADAHRLDLAAPGALCRALAVAAHHTDDIVEPMFDHWLDQLLAHSS